MFVKLAGFLFSLSSVRNSCSHPVQLLESRQEIEENCKRSAAGVMLLQHKTRAGGRWWKKDEEGKLPKYGSGADGDAADADAFNHIPSPIACIPSAMQGLHQILPLFGDANPFRRARILRFLNKRIRLAATLAVSTDPMVKSSVLWNSANRSRSTMINGDLL